MQMTRLNTKRLEDSFPQYKARVSSLSFLNSSPYLDATMRLNFDATSADMDGGLEITSIGKEQLKMMLFYVDPEGKDPSIESIRQVIFIDSFLATKSRMPPLRSTSPVAFAVASGDEIIGGQPNHRTGQGINALDRN